MNFLNKLVQDAKSLVVGMTPQAQILAVLLTIAIAVSATFLMNGASASSSKSEYLFDGRTFSESELDRFTIAFSSSSLRDWDRDGDRIKIPSNSKSAYYKAISDAKAMPDTLFGPMDDAMKGNSFLDSSKLTDAKQMNAKLKSIASTIESMPRIQEAFVTFAESPNGFSSAKQKSASIAVLAKGGIPLSMEQKRSIIHFVQKSLPGLKASDVVLMDLATSQTVGGEDDPTALIQDRYYMVKKQQEEDLKKRALELLRDYGNVRLEVSVEVDPTLEEETSRMNFDPKSTTIQTSSTKRDEDSQRLSTQGRPGAEPNVMPNRSATLSTPDQSSKTKESTESVKQVVGNTVTSSKKAGLQIKDASFAVTIPSSYYRKAFIVEQKERNPSYDEKTGPTEKDLETLRQKVETRIKKVLGALIQASTPGEDKLPRVTVDEYIDFPVQEIPEPSIATMAWNWLSQSWQTLLLALVALVAIVSMRGFVASGSRSNDADFERGFDLPIDDAADIDLAGLTNEEASQLNEGETADPNEPPRFKTTGGDIKTDLTSMVRENPDAAATLLRNWISGASA